MATPQNIDALLGMARPRQASAKPPTRALRKPLSLSFREWAGSQVAAYRLGLVLGYVAMVYFGVSAAMAGIPTFTFTTPEGFTPIWASGVVIGGFIAAVGSLRAGAEPITKGVRVYNQIEKVGSILLFATLGTYATILLFIGYGFGDGGRASSGAGFVALGVQPVVRMIWLIFRPRFLALTANGHHHIGPVLLVPEGYALMKLNPDGSVIVPQAPEGV